MSKWTVGENIESSEVNNMEDKSSWKIWNTQETKAEIRRIHIQYNMVKLQSVWNKEILQVAREKIQINNTGVKIRFTSTSLMATVGHRRYWIIFLKSKSTCNLELYPVNVTFGNEDKIEIFSEKQRLKEFNTNR